MQPKLVAFVFVTLLGLYALADWIAPYHNLSAEGCTVSYVYDGDTVELTCGATKETARLIGFDTPETKSPRCSAEAALGKQATLALRKLISAGTVTVSGNARDKYGRLLVDIETDGRSVGDLLIRRGLALPYTGGRRVNWCDHLEQ